MPGRSSNDDSSARFVELARLIGETLADLKHSGPPPPELRPAFEQFSLGPRHIPALMVVALSGPLSVSEVARQLGHTLPTTSTIVGELSRAGLVDRTEDEADRRRTIVVIDPTHLEVMTEWAYDTFAPARATLARLSPEAREHFIAGWRILHEEAARAAGGGRREAA